MTLAGMVCALLRSSVPLLPFLILVRNVLYVCAGLRLLLKTATEPWNVDFWVASSVLRKACDTCIMFELLVRVPGVDGV
jgi:hypothetical protein